ncbi:hypothetical protein [Geobacter sp. DSM 9736]|uniref:hypothetical protein n=1 Tax=Geobacter sp. DSM 9736 TaxID=1277350 RepID=UPI000B50DE83|nr:hypothetical protein [Geobacter sp. DSM 9736]SNB47822.1 hypothetical protein SAMN06269301_3316 [Geobacter sp. DSM 9736]
MAGKRGSVIGGVDFGSTNVCAILGNFTADGLDIVYKNLQARVLNFEHVDLGLSDRGEVQKATLKGGKYVRQKG